ncbi:MAG: metal ABC transporter permease, partial [Nevskiales bacterium]
MNFAAIDFGILAPAFVAGLLVTATHAPLGVQVLGRGIVFIDLAIAQVAGLGVIFADSLGFEAQGWGVQGAALAAALAGALLLTWTERRWPEVQEAIIGTTFVLAASGALLLLAANPHGGEHLKELLVGQILWVNWPRLLPVALVYAVILALWFGMGERIGRIGFYLLFAAAVTLSVQLVGLYLVFASLI